MNVRSGRGSQKQAFFASETLGHSLRGEVGDGDHLVDEVGVEHGRDEPCAKTLNAMQPRLPARQHRARARLDGDHPSVRVALLEHAPDPGERASSAYTGNERVDFAAGRLPDLLGGRLGMDVGIGGVFELTAHQ